MFLTKSHINAVLRISVVTWMAGFGLFLAMLCGCGGESDFPIAPVSGLVTLNGEPLPDASVGFEPISSGGGNGAGPGSYGKTDSEGRFVLATIRDDPGAVVGKHRVSISTFRPERDADGNMKIISEEKLPAKYNQETQLTKEVPAGGTDEANFDLKTQ